MPGGRWECILTTTKACWHGTHPLPSSNPTSYSTLNLTLSYRDPRSIPPRRRAKIWTSLYQISLCDYISGILQCGEPSIGIWGWAGEVGIRLLLLLRGGWRLLIEIRSVKAWGADRGRRVMGGRLGINRSAYPLSSSTHKKSNNSPRKSQVTPQLQHERTAERIKWGH